MERLTRKSLEYKDTWIADGSLSNIEGVVRGNAIDRLAELEDVLEKYGIENAEDLDGVLKPLIDNGELENWKSANFWKMQTERLKQELAELKQNAIVPKFKVGQEIYVIDDYFKVTSAIIERVIINKEYSISEGETSYVHYLANLGEKYEWDERYLILYGEEISLTKEEAEQKLAEIKGEK